MGMFRVAMKASNKQVEYRTLHPQEPNVNPTPASEPVEQSSADPSSSSALPMPAASAGSNAGGEAAIPCTAQAPRPSRVEKPPVWTKDYQLDL